jgi:hypothetical protein
MGKRKPPPGTGSGKFGTPLARIHRANAIPEAVASGAIEPELAAPPVLGVLDRAVVAEPLAAFNAEVFGRPEPPPHPAIGTQLRSVAVASRRARAERVNRF